MALNDICPTVQIDDGNGGFIVINECDFDEKKHNKYGEKKTRKPRAKQQEAQQDSE